MRSRRPLNPAEMKVKMEKTFSQLQPGMILDNKNKPVTEENFVHQLKESQRLRDVYVINIQIWQKFFEDNAHNIDLKKIIDTKLSELDQIASNFSQSEWKGLFQIIARMKNIMRD